MSHLNEIAARNRFCGGAFSIGDARSQGESVVAAVVESEPAMPQDAAFTEEMPMSEAAPARSL